MSALAIRTDGSLPLPFISEKPWDPDNGGRVKQREAGPFGHAQRRQKSLAVSGSVQLAMPLQSLERRRPLLHANGKQFASISCVAAKNLRCRASGQKQTITREAPTITKAPVQDPSVTPKLSDGGNGFPPRSGGDGGGGGGGGGENSSGGFILLGILGFLGFLKDLETKEDDRDG